MDQPGYSYQPPQPNEHQPLMQNEQTNQYQQHQFEQLQESQQVVYQQPMIYQNQSNEQQTITLGQNPIQCFCPHCNKGLKKNERRSVAVSVESLIVDFFRDLTINSPIDATKILFK